MTMKINYLLVFCLVTACWSPLFVHGQLITQHCPDDNSIMTPPSPLTSGSMAAKENYWPFSNLGNFPAEIHISFVCVSDPVANQGITYSAYFENLLRDYIDDFNYDIYENHALPIDVVPSRLPHIQDLKFKWVIDNIIYVADSNNTNEWFRDNKQPPQSLFTYLENNYPQTTKTFKVFLRDFCYLPNDTACGKVWGLSSSQPPSFLNSSQVNFQSKIDNTFYLEHPEGILAFRSHLAHELNHNFGLHHLYGNGGTSEDIIRSKPDFLEDVFGPDGHQDPWCNAPSDEACHYTKPHHVLTNNINSGRAEVDTITMSTIAAFWSPMQIARMRRGMMTTGMQRFITGYGGNSRIVISSNEVWTTRMKVYQDIVVQAGGSLTIQNDLYFVEEARIIIEPGGELIIDGALLTKANTYANHWQGIFVGGNPSQPQTASNQGKLEIRNGGTIEHALVGITTGYPLSNYTPPLPSGSGGIIECSNGIFRNNLQDVQINPYSVGNSRYKANFTNSQFVLSNDADWDYLQLLTEPRVKLNGVNGIRFNACTFTNTHSPQEFVALEVTQASFNIGRNSNGQGGQFNDWNYAVIAYSPLCPLLTVNTSIEGANFQNNIHSIYLMGVENPSIRNNSINSIVLPSWNGNPFISPNQPNTYGIYLDGITTGFTVEGNQVNGHMNPQAIEKAYGIVIHDGVGPNLVNNNQVENCDYGLHAIGVNRQLNNATIGLEFACNALGGEPFSVVQANGWDVLVSANAGLLTPGDGIALYQGNPNAIHWSQLPNNLFSYPHIDKHIANSANSFSYFYSDNLAQAYSERFEPSEVSGNVPVSRINISLVNWETICPDPPFATNGDITTALNSYTQQEAEVVNKTNLFVQLVNGGNTAAIESQLLFASDQEEYQMLYLDLMAAAPEVEEAILLDVFTLEDFPELALRNIMIANPHASRNEEIMTAIRAIEPPISQQTLTDIENGKTTYTTYDHLVFDMANAQSESERSSWKLLQLYANDSLNDRLNDIRNHLKMRDEPGFRYALIESYLYEGNNSLAQNEISAFETEVNLGDDEVLLMEWTSMKVLYNLLAQHAPNAWTNLNETEINTLVNVSADPWSFRAGIKAEALLRMNDTTSGYIEPLGTANGGFAKTSLDAQNEKNRPAFYTPKVELSPNPAENFVDVSWWGADQWAASESQVELKITDNSGRLVLSQTVEFTQYAQRLQIAQLTNGIYHLEVFMGRKSVFQQKLIKH